MCQLYHQSDVEAKADCLVDYSFGLNKVKRFPNAQGGKSYEVLRFFKNFFRQVQERDEAMCDAVLLGVYDGIKVCMPRCCRLHTPGWVWG